jgi:peptide/nickel transport system permease protein
MAGAFLIVLLILTAVLADVIAPYPMDEQRLTSRFLRPSLDHLFGTDNLGRDVFSRVVYGSRVSLTIGLSSTIFGALLGIILGSISGFYGGRTDNVIMRGVDVMLAIPNLLLAISVLAALGPGVTNTIIAVSIGSVPRYSRVIRASVLTVKEQEYIEAARAIGTTDFRIVLRHILPNCLAPVLVQATLGVANTILIATSLSFIGLGVQPPTAEWGAMLSAARPYIRQHWPMVMFPGLAIVATIFGLNLFGDGLRDALDPRLKR